MDNETVGYSILSYAISAICVLVIIYYGEKKFGFNLMPRDEAETRGRMITAIIAIVLMSCIHAIFLHVMIK